VPNVFQEQENVMKTILIQLDTDPLPSSFDQVVAVDAGADQLLSYGGVNPDNVTGLVHGAIFTRGVPDLKHTAIFVGGSDVAAGERLIKKVTKTFFGPMRVSLMMDSNGCNTTAAAAVAFARSRMSLTGKRAVVLGATGPVGIRAVQLLAAEGASVRAVSRTLDRAQGVCESIAAHSPDSVLEPAAAATPSDFENVCRDAEIVIAAGAAGVCFLQENTLVQLPKLKIAIDLNAVPPVGIADIGVMDKAVEKSGILCYGALGVGGLKMKVHKQAIRQLFQSNDQVLDTRTIYELALNTLGVTK
jgi:hypothetical protein